MLSKGQPAVRSGGPERDGSGRGQSQGHHTAILLNGKVVMQVVGGVAYRTAGAGEMLLKPPAWSFHETVLRQLERAEATCLVVTDASTGTIYRVDWVTFANLSVATDRGHGPQRYLPLRYWRTDPRVPAPTHDAHESQPVTTTQPAAQPSLWGPS